MITATDAFDLWEGAFLHDDEAPLRKMFAGDFVMIDSDSNLENLDQVMEWATREDFHIGDFDIVHDYDHCCCGTHSLAFGGQKHGKVCFFALKSKEHIFLWKIQRTPSSDE